jgi:cytochrome oxidase assembly protein ShyY1
MTEMGPAMHIGYAVQWFGLALALVVIYLVVNISRNGESKRD